MKSQIGHANIFVNTSTIMTANNFGNSRQVDSDDGTPQLLRIDEREVEDCQLLSSSGDTT